MASARLELMRRVERHLKLYGDRLCTHDIAEHLIMPYTQREFRQLAMVLELLSRQGRIRKLEREDSYGTMLVWWEVP